MKTQTRAIIGLGILILLIFVVDRADLAFWLAPPQKKFALAIKTDFKLLAANHYFPPAWSKIKAIEMSSDASHVQNWLNPSALEIQTKPDGEFALKVFVSEWIDGYRYGALIQYDLVDIKTKNTVWELNRTYKLGLMY